MTFLLDVIYIIAGVLASPFLLFKAATSERWRAGWAERFGRAPMRAGEKKCVWIHTVSVGETTAVRQLVELLDKQHPEWDVRISTTTNTGQKVARDLYGPERCFYFPLDLSFAIRRAVRRIRPTVVVLVELELWPNFLRGARAKDIPILVINGRMREERVKRYRAGRWLFKAALRKDSGNVFCVQNDTYRRRFERAGIPPEMIHVTGNMKYDALRTDDDPTRVSELRSALGLNETDRVWAAGCTWPGEEKLCLRVHRMLQKHDSELRLVIAPRHIERAGEVARVIEQAGYTPRRRSAEEGPSGPSTIGLLDTMGELSYLYALVDVAFVGKSLTAQGGHNLLEPAALGTPPVFGPLADNFEEEARLLLEAQARERVADEAELGQALLRLLRDNALREDRAERGRHAVMTHRGASEKNLEVVRRIMSDETSQ